MPCHWLWRSKTFPTCRNRLWRCGHTKVLPRQRCAADISTSSEHVWIDFAIFTKMAATRRDIRQSKWFLRDADFLIFFKLSLLMKSRLQWLPVYVGGMLHPRRRKYAWRSSSGKPHGREDISVLFRYGIFYRCWNSWLWTPLWKKWWREWFRKLVGMHCRLNLFMSWSSLLTQPVLWSGVRLNLVHVHLSTRCLLLTYRNFKTGNYLSTKENSRHRGQVSRLPGD